MPRLHVRRATWTCLFGLLLVLAPAFARAFPCPERPLRVAFDDRGYNYFQGKGFDADIATELGKRSGCTLVFQEMPRARIFVSLERGDVDVALFAIQTPARDQYAWFAPYMVQKNFVHLTPAIATRVRSQSAFEADPTLLFGVVRGFTHGDHYEDMLKRLRAQNRVVEVSNSEQLFKMLASGRIQAAMSLPAVSTMYAEKIVPNLAQSPGLDWDARSPAPAHQLMLSKASVSAGQAKEWQAAMAKMVQDGTVKRIIANYLSGSALKRSLLP